MFSATVRCFHTLKRTVSNTGYASFFRSEGMETQGSSGAFSPTKLQGVTLHNFALGLRTSRAVWLHQFRTLASCSKSRNRKLETCSTTLKDCNIQCVPFIVSPSTEACIRRDSCCTRGDNERDNLSKVTAHPHPHPQPRHQNCHACGCAY